jgi:hypothetical protein
MKKNSHQELEDFQRWRRLLESRTNDVEIRIQRLEAQRRLSLRRVENEDNNGHDAPKG